MPTSIDTAIVNTNDIHKGQVTQIQDQSIILVNFKIKNTIKSVNAIFFFFSFYFFDTNIIEKKETSKYFGGFL